MSLPPRPLPYRHKFPAEARLVTFSFKKKLRAGAQLSGTFTFQKEDGLVFSAGSLEGTEVTTMWTGGDLGKKYKGACFAPATNGELLQLAAEFGIEEAN